MVQVQKIVLHYEISSATSNAISEVCRAMTQRICGVTILPADCLCLSVLVRCTLSTHVNAARCGETSRALECHLCIVSSSSSVAG